MSNLSSKDIALVKGQGFLLNRGTDRFSGRIYADGTVFTAEDFTAMSQIASKCGNGKLICTSRQCIEIPGIAFENIDCAKKMASDAGLSFGGTGSKVRPVTACKGTTCVYGNFDTQALASKIHHAFYLGYSSVVLPHKFKISVGGCPNSCIKPSLNDFGIEGHKLPSYNDDNCKGCKKCFVEAACPMKAAKKTEKLEISDDCLSCGVCIGKCPFGAIAKEGQVLYKIYVGGTWGKRTRMGTALSRFVTEDEILPILEKSILWFRENAYQKERFGLAIDRIGIDSLEKALFSDDLLNRKAEILEKELLTRD